MKAYRFTDAQVIALFEGGQGQSPGQGRLLPPRDFRQGAVLLKSQSRRYASLGCPAAQAT